MIDSQETTDPEASATAEMESARSLGAAAAAVPPPIPVNVCNPLSAPYRTGSYLIYDVKLGGPDNFRSGLNLTPNPYRASGSHQLNYADFVRVFGLIPGPAQPSILYLIDLREETHGFSDGIAVSWYADNDFSNVGQPLSWAVDEEKVLMDLMEGLQTAWVFEIEPDASDDRAQERMRPTRYWDVKVGAAKTEEQLFDNYKIGNFTVQYVRIAVTDHCAPSDAALNELRTVANKVTPNDWVHFHCHGGDGRTTTFLALYDMWCWKKANYPGYLSLEGFACRQYKLAANYWVNPFGCNCVPPPPPPSQPIAGWKRPLALERWKKLQQFHDNPLGTSVG
jgi:protein-tyrosine phosphatase